MCYLTKIIQNTSKNGTKLLNRIKSINEVPTFIYGVELY